MAVLSQDVQSATEFLNLSGVSGKNGSGSMSEEFHIFELSLFCGGDKTTDPNIDRTNSLI